MCGIVAYIGHNDCLSILLSGLESLEYRGYDSAGVGLLVKDQLLLYKSVGSIEDLKSKLPENREPSYCGFGHTRWATHGKPCKRNSHPHITKDCRLGLVHNGIIENYEELKESLSKKYKFLSDTDSEVLLYLIYDFLENNNLEQAVKLALNKVVGAYAIVVIDRENPQYIVAARKGSPLVVGLGVHEIIVASDVGAFGSIASVGVVYLEDNSLAKIGDKLETFSLNHGKEYEYSIEKVYDNVVQVTKGSFDSFMLKEIYEQPKAVDDCLSGRLDGYRIKYGGLIGYENIFKKAKHITILGCGSSWHAGLIGKYYIEEFCKIKVSVEYASEFRYRKPCIEKGDIVIGISQSGETADTISALEIAKIYGATIVGICNVPNSSIARMCDCGVYIKAGVEVGVASTKAFTNQVLSLLMLSLWIEQNINIMSNDHRKVIFDDLRDCSRVLNDTLRCYDTIEYLAEIFRNVTNCLFLGRGYNFPVALEGALKLKELSYVHAEGYPAAEMKHGPIALIDKNMPVVVIANNYQHQSKIVNNIKEIQAREGKVITIYSNLDVMGDYRVRIPGCCDVLSPLLSVIPLQLFSYYSAKLRGKNVDRPRNLAKSVTVE